MKKFDCILLIDDNPDCLFLNKHYLTEQECTEKIIGLTDGNSAIDYLELCLKEKINFPDIIFVDVNMSPMNAWEFLDIFERNFPALTSTRIIILTGFVNEKDKIKAFSYPFVNDYMDKFLIPEAMLEILKRHFPDRLNHS